VIEKLARRQIAQDIAAKADEVEEGGIVMLRANFLQRVNVADLLLRSAERFPNKEIVCDRGCRWTYRDFDQWVNRVARMLSALGLKGGEAFALMAGNSAEFLAVYFAAARIGLVVVPVNLLWRKGELSYVLENANVRAAIVEAEYLNRFMEAATETPVPDVVVIGAAKSGDGAARPATTIYSDFDRMIAMQASDAVEVDVADRATLSYLYTSGTTSVPKGVEGHHLGIYLESLGVALDMKMSHDERLMVVLPMFHTAQLNALCTPAIAVGASMVIERTFEAEAMLDFIETEKVTLIFVLPMMLQAIIAQQEKRARNIDSLRLVIYAMAPMPTAELHRAIDVLKCDFGLLFGQTEMAPVTTFFRPEQQMTHTGSLGMSSVNVQMAIMGPDGTVMPRNSSGEIVYRSPQTMTGYLRNPAATEEAFKHGWFHSGDVGRIDEDGVLWFEDRLKDVIKTGGENVSSVEVELAIRATEPRIREVAVIGLPHERWGEAITAVVVPDPEAEFDADDLLEKLRGRLSVFKCPKAIIPQGELPRTATGKVEKARLRKTFERYYE
jgi:acyl-CoA synthetase (AMP-forming)/AMP-acid ligase II